LIHELGMAMKVKINEKNRERIRIAQRLGQPDQVPVDLSPGAQFNYLHGWLDLDGRRFFLDPEYIFEAQMRFFERFNVEGTLGPKFGLAVEPSYFGAEIIIRRDTSPWVKPNLDSLDKLEAFLKHYREPDPYTAGYFPVVSQCYFYFKERLGSLISPPMGFLGPFDTASSLVGHTNMYMWLKDRPDLIHDLLGRVTDFFIKNLEVRCEVFKPGHTNLSLADDLCGFLSREDFLEFEFPYIKKLFDAYCDKQSLRQFHCDGPLTHVVDLLPEMGVNVLLSFDPTADLKLFKEKIGDRVCLKGNIHPLKFLRFGNPESIKQEVKRELDSAKAGGGYIMCTGGELGDGTPDENIDAMIEATEEFGKY